MDRDPRERERGGARSDVASLWIDFLLLPQKLEEHLAAGSAAIPTPPDLISMFLEQALLNHKAVLGNNSSANSTVKDGEPQGTGKITSRTASLLCERAARVAVVTKLTLSDIESAIPSQSHQFLTLKALIRHDKSRSLLHQCDLHRWLIHKVLQSHPIGSASPNAVLPVTRLGTWATGDDLGEVFQGVINGNGDVPSGTGDSRAEEEQASVEFLEQILHDEGTALEHEQSTNSEADSGLNGMANGGLSREPSLSTAYKCQVIFDVAEVHFMRGRIRKAHELFCKCGELVTSLSLRKRGSAMENRGGLAVTSESDNLGLGSVCQVSPVSEDRLAGFIIACKMLLGTSPNGNSGELTRPQKDPGMRDTCCVGTSSSQWAVIACEQSRLIARKYSTYNTPQCDFTNGVSGGIDFFSGRENGVLESGRTGSSVFACPVPSRRHRKRTYLEGAHMDLAQKDLFAEGEIKNGESVEWVKEFRRKEASLDEMHVDKDSTFTLKEHSEAHLSNGNEVKLQVKKSFEIEEKSRDRRVVDLKDEKGMVGNSMENISRIQVHMVDREAINDAVAADDGSVMQLFVDLKSDLTVDNDSKPTPPSVKQEKSLIQIFVEDILRGHLSWGYLLSLEKDPFLSKSVRCKLAACNVVRSVLEGAPVQSFLRISDLFRNSRDAVEFLMQLLLAIKVMQAGNTFAVHRPHGVDLRQSRRLFKLGLLKHNLSFQGAKDSDVSVITHVVRDLSMYICSVIDKPWCWSSALKHGLVGQSDLPRFCGRLWSDILEGVDGSCTLDTAAAQMESLQHTDGPAVDSHMEFLDNEILLRLAQVENLLEIQALVGEVQKVAERVGNCKESSSEVHGPYKVRHAKSMSSDLVEKIGNQTQVESKSWLISSDNQTKCEMSDTCWKCHKAAIGQDRKEFSSLGADVAAILRRRAFTALEMAKDTYVAKRLYELALTLQPMDYDSAMMLWLLEKYTESGDQGATQGMRGLPLKCEEDALPTSGLLNFMILQLIEKELWGNLSELCKWAFSVVLQEPVGKGREQSTVIVTDSAVAPTSGGGTHESGSERNSAGWWLRQNRFRQTLSVARIVVDLMPLCVSLQTAASRNHFNEEVARLGSTLSQLFEEFMCVLVGVESNGQGADDTPQWRGGTQLEMGLATYHPGAAGVELISRVSNPRVLMALASLTAGWLQRCHVVGLARWNLAVERYGVLAGVTAAASPSPQVGSLSYTGSVLRPRVPPEFGRDLFFVLLEGIVGLPGVVEGDREKGHRWLQGLADLAFEDEAYDKALHLYLQAGAIRSAQYCDRASSMNRDIFTPWVIQRMVAACRAIGAGLQAAVLCQCLPVPDHELAFQILQENTLITDRDATAYFECLWEIPILELLVHLHSRAGDEGRVSSLIALLQQPALNVHNPPAIRQAHISTMEQRFLQRFAAEML